MKKKKSENFPLINVKKRKKRNMVSINRISGIRLPLHEEGQHLQTINDDTLG